MHEGNVGISLQVIWNGTFFQSWLSPCRKQGISLPCQRGKPDELRRLFLILIYCLIVCSNQQGKQRRSSWSHARILFSFGTLLQQQLGIFLQHCAPELSAGNTLCRIPQSCWNIVCPLSTSCRAHLTLPCSLLGASIPSAAQQVIQAWSGLRSRPLTFSKKGTHPASAVVGV